MARRRTDRRRKTTPDRGQGTVSVHTRGFGFLQLEDGDRASAFIAPPDLAPFLEGDRVAARVESSGDGRFQAKDLELVGRWREEVIGRVVRKDGQVLLDLDPRVGTTPWPLVDVPRRLRSGQVVVAGVEVNSTEVRFLRVVSAGEAALESVLVAHGIRGEFPPECEAEATRPAPRELSRGRRDLRDLPTVTIDGASTRDIDDALSALPAQADGAVRVFVSIADVAARVTPGSALDDEARRRLTSVYLPDRVVPMLPTSLSEDGLSLREGEERAALTVELRIDPEGGVTAIDIVESVIRSDARLVYEDVAAFLDGAADGHPTRQVPPAVHSTLRWLRTAAGRLSAVRASRGGVHFGHEEVRLTLDPSGEPTSVESHALTSAHLLVERLMVAANEAVGRWLIDRGLPGIFRVQSEPDPEQVEQLVEFARNFGFETGFGPRLTPRGLAAFEEQFASASVAPSIRTVLRWALGRASYEAAVAPHFALAAPVYVHFTSPIRRYADLVVHRFVKDHLHGQRHRDGSDADLSLVEDLNEKSARAQRAERERTRMLVARFFTSRIGESHGGNVVAVKPWGLVIQLVGSGVTGTVATDLLPGGPYALDATGHALQGPKRRFLAGEPLDVVVRGTDEALGRLELEPAIRT